MRKTATVILALLLGASLAMAQNGAIHGQVFDEQNKPLAGANVYIQSLGLGAATDLSGEFSLLAVPEGLQEVTADYIGYQKTVLNVEVHSGEVSGVIFELKSAALQGDIIVVESERLKGQAQSLNIQKTNPNITNIVSADQIGRFPDSNIGDALKRIPGIHVNYDQGEARFVNIRGTEPRLNSVMINGDRVPSAEAEIRSVQVDLIPAEAIQTIEVSKAVTPDMDADAIGGAVNLITRGAPYEMRLSGTIGGVYSQLSGESRPMSSLVFGNRFLDNRFGIIASVSYYNYKYGSDNAEGAWTMDDNVIYPEEWQVRQYQVHRERQSYSLGLDYKFSPSHTLTFKGIYNHRNDWENRYRLRTKDISKPENGMSTVEELVREVKGGISDNDNARLEDQRTSSFTLNGDHVIGDLKVNWSGSYAKASEERPNERYLAWHLEGEFDYNVDLSDENTPYFTPVNSSEVAFQNYELDELTEEYKYTEEVDQKIKVDFEWPLIKSGDFKNKIQAGVKYKQKDKERANEFYEYEPTGDLGFGVIKDYSKGDFQAGDYKIGEFTSAYTLGQLDLNNPVLFEKESVPGEFAANNFTATEKISAGYLEINQKISDKWQIIAGIRMEQTHIDYTGNEYIEENENGEEEINPTVGKEDYINILPGIHVNYRLTDQTNLRFAYTNTIARPGYYDLVPYRQISGGDEELAVGNPALEPTTSMNFDVMAEHFYKNVGIFSTGFFYKDINDFIYVHNESDYLDPVSGNTYEDFLQPRNGATASLWGLEFAYQRRLDFLPGMIKYFSVYANYTYTSSEADNPVLNDQIEDEKTIELPGTAPHTFNTNLTYDDGRLVVGLSFNFTSPYIDPDEMDLTPGLERYYDQVTFLDLNGSYAITKQFRVFFEANNLLNQPLRYYAGDQNRTYQAEYYRSRFTLGVKYDL